MLVGNIKFGSMIMFRIGQFSKFAQVPVSQLRYYADIGLLLPTHTDPMTGYRYYTAEQLPLLNRIIALKELGLPLAGIQEVIRDDISNEEIRGMLILQKKQVEQTLQEEAQRLHKIEARLTHLDTASQQQLDVVIKQMPAQPYIGLRSQVPNVAVGQAIMLDMLQIIPQKVGSRNMTHFLAVLHNDSYTLEDMDIEGGIGLVEPTNLRLRLASGLEVMGAELPAVDQMATFVHVGPMLEAPILYAKFAFWITQHAYEVVGPGREVFIVPPTAPEDPNAVIEIQFPVQQSEETT